MGLDFTFLLSSLLRPSSSPSDHHHSVFTSLSPLPGKNLEAATYFGSFPVTEESGSAAGQSSSMRRERSGSSTKNSVVSLNSHSRPRLPSAGASSSGGESGRATLNIGETREPSPSLPPRSEKRGRAPPRSSMEGYL